MTIDLNHKNRKYRISKEVLYKMYVEDNRTQMSISRELNIPIQSLSKFLDYYNIKKRYKWGKYALPGDISRVNTNGYWRLYKPDHPRADAHGLTPEHIILIEKEINRSLKDKEIIHHIDLIKINNDIKNLLLCENQSEHQKIHKQLLELVSELIKDTKIIFDRKENKYVKNL